MVSLAGPAIHHWPGMSPAWKGAVGRGSSQLLWPQLQVEQLTLTSDMIVVILSTIILRDSWLQSLGTAASSSWGSEDAQVPGS